MGAICRASALLIAVTAGAIFDIPSASAGNSPLNPSAPCSVFDSAPCTPSFCGVFDAWPCVPSLPSIGQGLRVTVAANRWGQPARAPQDPVNTIQELFAALRACWEPPPLEDAFPGMEMSVQLSFKRNGEIFAPPRVTYANKKADSEVRRRYRRAIDAAIERCTPMPFTDAMGGAIAGRQVSVRFVDDRRGSND
jgi:hypothetical protein